MTFEELMRKGASVLKKMPSILPDSPLDLKMKRLMREKKMLKEYEQEEKQRKKTKKKKVIKYPPPKKKKKKIKYPPPKKKKRNTIKGIEVIEMNIYPKKRK